MKSRAFATLDLLLAVTVVSAAGAVVSPAVTRTRAQQMESVCQRNLQLLSAAVAMYVEDYGAYPTNRVSAQGAISEQAFLSPAGAPTQLQITWVEGVDRYLAPAGTPQDKLPVTKTAREKSVWRCPASEGDFPPGIESAGYGAGRVCYILNINLLEKTPTQVEDAARTMTLREVGLGGQSYAFGRQASAVWTPSKVFLSDPDTFGGNLANRRPHRGGSYIVFADGHLKHFTNDVATRDRLRNDFASDPGRWGAEAPDHPGEALMWVTL